MDINNIDSGLDDIDQAKWTESCVGPAAQIGDVSLI